MQLLRLAALSLLFRAGLSDRVAQAARGLAASASDAGRQQTAAPSFGSASSAGEGLEEKERRQASRDGGRAQRRRPSRRKVVRPRLAHPRIVGSGGQRRASDVEAKAAAQAKAAAGARPRRYLSRSLRVAAKGLENTLHKGIVPDVLGFVAPDTDLARTMDGLSGTVWTFWSWAEGETPTTFDSPLPDIIVFAFAEEDGDMACVCDTKELLGEWVMTAPMHLKPTHNATGAFMYLRGTLPSPLPRTSGPTTFEFALTGGVLKVRVRWMFLDGEEGETSIQVHRRSAPEFGGARAGDYV
mmetsp:Transcript_30463/g.86914  ORF Transcript_30463/g.86914 Transcript_30463/m.86914 type:complete len:298 (+) Transcript_30463:57-950(+)|eukprot:CAMPEP_0176253766 /NCGR_PEP_ID=MMETSP0121_2-20121125/36186_1 /TAXON_ID=160619 /ORGANISM="Kryptoperidinium foliaceum, Strain CCMP 1326" /LENGTH=297 /DNA_ID=CAMNT_0017593555 /DNA_START=40 /DNA_END=933 /DNA_ORIENTATION=+